MKPLITQIILVVLLMGFTTPISHRGIHPPQAGREDTEPLIIDLSKTLPANPYQTEYERMLYPTVRIKTPNSTGSGVIFTAKDAKTIYILTACHVVGDNTVVTVELFYPITPVIPAQAGIQVEATVIITDTVKDLALLKSPLPPFAKGGKEGIIYSAWLAPKDYKPYLFAPVWAVGCSLGLPSRPSQGIISAIHPSPFPLPQGERIGEGDSYWEISAPILPGNSGGPVFDTKTYEVIGISVWVHTYKNQLVTTMAGVVPVSEIYEFLNSHKDTKSTKK